MQLRTPLAKFILMRKRALPPSGDGGCRICRRRDHQSRSGWNSTGPSSVIIIATTLLAPDTHRPFPASFGFASLRGSKFPFVRPFRV